MCSFHPGPSAEERAAFERAHGHQMAPSRGEYTQGWDPTTARYCPACALTLIKYLASGTLRHHDIQIDGKPIAEVVPASPPDDTGPKYVRHMLEQMARQKAGVS